MSYCTMRKSDHFSRKVVVASVDIDPTNDTTCPGRFCQNTDQIWTLKFHRQKDLIIRKTVREGADALGLQTGDGAIVVICGENSPDGDFLAILFG